MTNLDIIEFIDEFLSEQEDVLHGIEGRDCTKSRKYLDMIKKQLSIHGVVKSLPTEQCVRDWYKEGNNDAGFWTTKIEIDNETVFTEVYKALKYFINRWQ